jgi:hypothetical protein
MLDDWKIKHCEGALKLTRELLQKLQTNEAQLFANFFGGLFDKIKSIYKNALDEARNVTNENIGKNKKSMIWHNILSQTHRLTKDTCWTPSYLCELFNGGAIDQASSRVVIATSVQVFQRTLESLSFQVYKFKPLETIPNVEHFLQQIDQSEQQTISYIGGWVVFSLSINHEKD